MKFQVGEKVVHPRHGVGEVISVGKEKFFDQKARRYYEVETPRLTVWVPVEGEDNSGLRDLTPKSELPHYREILMARPEKLPQNYRSRQSYIRKRLEEGTLESLCTTVRDLAARDRKKPLNGTDEASLRKARRNLIAEWAASAGMSTAQAEQQIDRLLAESQARTQKKSEQAKNASVAYAD